MPVRLDVTGCSPRPELKIRRFPTGPFALPMLVVATTWAAWHGELVISALPSMVTCRKRNLATGHTGTDRRCTGRFSSDPRVASLIDGSIVMYYGASLLGLALLHQHTQMDVPS